MKIRTKIIFISSVAVLSATLLISGIIWNMLNKSRENEAYMKAYQSSFYLMTNFQQMLEHSGGDDVQIEYFLKTYQIAAIGDAKRYQVCFRMSRDGSEDVEIFNPTIFSLQKLLKQNYNICEEEAEISYGRISYEGGEYLIFRKTFAEDIVLFQLEDITAVKESMKILAAALLITSVGVTAMVMLFLWFTLGRMILPLQQLNDTVKEIAKGAYDNRVEICQKDEIGELAESFNQMAEAVEMRTRRIEESEHRKTLFMGNLTHELKTPMTAISGYAQTLLTMKLEPEEREEALVYIYEQCKRLERLSRKMMRLLELDSEEALHMTDVSVDELFEEAEKSCSMLLKEKNMKVRRITHGEHFPMDYDLMMDVMINLIDNGIKASEPGSEILLLADEKGIAVQDFGRGIPKEEKDRILEPFYMIDKSRSRKNGGAGLGLSLTALIIKRHNMRMDIESEVGRGTRVNLQFVYDTMNT